MPDLLTSEQLAQLDVPGPRYTSYPTADRFVEAFGPAQYRQALAERSRFAAGHGQPLSLYVHVPFCESLCWYCACNKIVTKRHEQASNYLALLAREVDLHAQAFGSPQPCSQLHLGGGTPTFLSDHELALLVQGMQRAFRLLPGAELSIEVDPRTVDRERLRALRALGFTRLSFGVQDFDPAVQQAVHRVQPRQSVERLMHEARALGFAAINVDLIYGLPQQTAESFARTIKEVAALKPSRIALYAYAHLPERFKPQRRINASALPPPAARVQMLGNAIAGFLSHGYTYIGMDHFALPGDSLEVARRQGRLHRNFQGYTPQPDGDLVGLGVSAIGSVGAHYSQNAKTLAEYADALQRGEFPVVRGLQLTREDLLRRAVIMALMCQGRVDVEAIETAHLVRFRECFAAELARLREHESLGLVSVGDREISLSATGWFFVRSIAMVFDRHLQAAHARTLYSKVI
jgi:oxygen-independent coproporphyrinogen III oxidase